MHEVNMGAAIAGKRRQLDMTQEDLAAALGVTKAAVSKWEIGQSLPDVALIPRIASVLGTGLDELFDYRPQMTQEESVALYRDLLAGFQQDVPTALARCRDAAALYWSCQPALSSIGSALFFEAARLERSDDDGESAIPLAKEAARIFERIEGLCDDYAAIGQARTFRAEALRLLGDDDAALELLEPLMARQPLGAEAGVAAIYQDRGETEKALRIHQQSILSGLILMLGGLMGIGASGDGDAVEEALSLVEALDEALGLTGFCPSALSTLRRARAQCLLDCGEAGQALDLLPRYAEAVGREARGIAAPAPPPIFDKVPDLLPHAPDAELTGRVASDYRAAALKFLEDEPRWDAYRDDARYREAAKLLEGGPHHG